MVKRSVRLKLVFDSVLVCGQQFAQMKTFNVRKCRNIKRKALGFIKALEWTVKFMVLKHERLDFLRGQTFSPIPFEDSKTELLISENKHFAEMFQ